MDDHQSELVRLSTEMTYDSLNIIDYLSFIIWLFIVFSGINAIYLGMKYLRYAQITAGLNTKKLQSTSLNVGDEVKEQGIAAEP